jgi:hypothetical protein
MLMVAHVTVLFSGAYLCHPALAASRPDPRQLTEFYFWLALGGALGGVFAAVIAPNVFSTIFEYPLLVATLPFFRQARTLPGPRWKDFAYPSIIAALFLTNWYVGETRLGLAPDVAFFIALFWLQPRRLRFGLAYAILLLGYCLTMPAFVENGESFIVAIFRRRSVDRDRNMEAASCDALHGSESLDRENWNWRCRITLGPASDVMSLIEDARISVGVVGLGTGSMAAMAANRRITFFDKPQVETSRGFFIS